MHARTHAISNRFRSRVGRPRSPSITHRRNHPFLERERGGTRESGVEKKRGKRGVRVARHEILLSPVNWTGGYIFSPFLAPSPSFFNLSTDVDNTLEIYVGVSSSNFEWYNKSYKRGRGKFDRLRPRDNAELCFFSWGPIKFLRCGVDLRRGIINTIFA